MATQLTTSCFFGPQSVAPKWSIEPSDTHIVRGSGSSIDCMASGFPPPRIIWTKASVVDSAQVVALSTTTTTTTNTNTKQDSNKLQSHLGAWVSMRANCHLAWTIVEIIYLTYLLLLPKYTWTYTHAHTQLSALLCRVLTCACSKMARLMCWTRAIQTLDITCARRRMAWGQVWVKSFEWQSTVSSSSFIHSLTLSLITSD